MQQHVLVAYDSYMGGTAGIARVITDELIRAGLEVDLRPAAAVDSVRGYDAVIIGSPLYYGRWRHDSMHLLRHRQGELSRRRVWLFQSGLSVIAPDAGDVTPPEVNALAHSIHAVGPMTFGGRLTRQTARGVLPRLMARRSTGVGDFRDLDQVARWANSIAQALLASAPHHAAPAAADSPVRA
jgi:menaquinone-dependent protoporphyrinogen oxidase